MVINFWEVCSSSGQSKFIDFQVNERAKIFLIQRSHIIIPVLVRLMSKTYSCHKDIFKLSIEALLSAIPEEDYQQANLAALKVEAVASH